jgi:hypothetical protein
MAGTLADATLIAAIAKTVQRIARTVRCLEASRQPPVASVNSRSLDIEWLPGMARQ